MFRLVGGFPSSAATVLPVLPVLQLTYPSVPVSRVAIIASSLPGAVVSWEMVSRVFHDGCESIPSPVLQTGSRPTFSYVAAHLLVSDAITPSSLARAVNTRESMSRSGTATTSSTSAALVGFQDGQSSRTVSFLVPRKWTLSPGSQKPAIMNDVLPVMPPAFRASGGRIDLTCVLVLLDIALHVFLGSHIQAVGDFLDGVTRGLVNFDGESAIMSFRR